MTINIAPVDFREIPKNPVQLLKDHWKAAAAVTVCFTIVTPLLGCIYFRRARSSSPLKNPAPYSIILRSFFERPLLKDIDTAKLRFTDKALNRQYSRLKPGGNETLSLKFSKVCNDLLEALRIENERQNNSILILDAEHYGPVIEAWPCGLEGRSYQTADDEHKNLSWLHQVLKALVDDRYISSFEMSEKGDRREIRIIV